MESKLGMSFKKSWSGALVFTFVLESPFLPCLLELVSTLIAELLPGLSLLPSPLPFSLSCERLKLLPFLILSTEVPLLLLSLSRDELLLVHSWHLSVEWLRSLGFLLCNGVRDLFRDLSDDDWMRPLLSDEDQEEWENRNANAMYNERATATFQSNKRQLKLTQAATNNLDSM